ncbi:MAG: hypothetical protein P8Z35_16530 [Ignavibacteriaceae bacterium]|jgi:hypothetical protein
MLLLKALGIWFLLAVLAVINGTIRTFLILPALGEQAAHVAGTIIFLLLQFTVIYFFIKKSSLKRMKELISIGLFWLFLTIAFEFIFGHYVMNHSWEKLLADYNILKGRLWILVLLNNLIAPLICGKYLLRKKIV